MDTLLDTKFWNKDIEGGVEDTNNLRLTNDRTITLSKVRDQDAEEEMGRLLLSKGGRIAFAETDISNMKKTIRNETLHIALLRNFRDSITIHSKLDIG